jgi:hypothetical protein
LCGEILQKEAISFITPSREQQPLNVAVETGNEILLSELELRSGRASVLKCMLVA